MLRQPSGTMVGSASGGGRSSRYVYFASQHASVASCSAMACRAYTRDALGASESNGCSEDFRLGLSAGPRLKETRLQTGKMIGGGGQREILVSGVLRAGHA